MPTGSGAHIAATRLPSAPRSTSARIETGTIALSSTSSVIAAVQAHVAPEGPRHRREHDVVDRPAEGVLDRLELGEVATDPGESAVGTDPDVVRARGRGLEPGSGRPRRHRRGSRRRGRPMCAGPRRTRCARRGAISAGTVARSTSASPRSWTPVGTGRGIQSWSGGATGTGSAEASNRTVAMSTPETPSTSAWWVLESSAKPPSARPSTSHSSHSGRSRSSAWRVDAAGQALELALAARAGEGGVADVEGDVEVRVVDPDRTPLAEGNEGQSLPVAGNEMQARLDRLDQLVVGRWRALEHRAPGDMHVGRLALEVQERAVESAQAIGVGHRSRLCRRPGSGVRAVCDHPHTVRSRSLPLSAGRSIDLPSSPARCGGNGGPTARRSTAPRAGANRPHGNRRRRSVATGTKRGCADVDGREPVS